MLSTNLDGRILERGKKTNGFNDEQLKEFISLFSEEKLELAFSEEFALLNLVFDFNVPPELMEIVKELHRRSEFNLSYKNDYYTICKVKKLYESFKVSFGYLPNIFSYLISTVTELNTDLVAKRFNVKSMKFALSLEQELPSVYHRIAFSIMFHKRIYDVVSKLKKYNRNLESFISGMPCQYPLADQELEQWIISHVGKTKNETIHEVITFWNDETFPKKSPLEIKKNYFSLQRKEMEWNRCKHKYPEAFQLPFSCNLINVKIEINQEKVCILDPNDKKQVILGQLSVCCQRLNGSAEASMMEGLLNPDSGFLIFERKNKLLAQSWIWLTADHSILVLDNIELADERKPEDIILLLKQWIIHSPYSDIQMGIGFNDITIGELVKEELKWYKQHWKYQYTDANDRVWLKKDNKLMI
ncbi:hypothetical protein [Priestia megaterium]|uniref:hypothetical protein n=1 Tax=Priestia megaterium TaxID=1404 RepID=UPI003241F569